MLVRAIFLAFVTIFCALSADRNEAVLGRWAARAPDPIGRTEEIELHFTAVDGRLSGMLHTADGNTALAEVRFQGSTLTFDAARPHRGRSILYHYEGTLSGDTLDFTVQNDDGSSFFRFTAHRQP